MTKVFIKPIEGALVRHPITMTPLSKDGIEIDLDSTDGTYWRRRIADCSVIVYSLNPVKIQEKEEIIKEEIKFKGGKRA